MNTEAMQMKRYFALSLALHLLLFFYILIKTAFFPSAPIEYIPSLRVDLVALPDFKKNEQVTPKTAEAESKTAPKPETKTPKMAIEDEGDITLSKKKSKKETAADKRKAALERIKALERVKALAGTDIKGNKISKGTALTGAAKASLEAHYLDKLVDQVRINWELPKWLREQSLSAQVIVRIDSTGGMKSMQFVKPSGSEQFDAEVRRAIMETIPFAPPPPELAGQMASDGVKLGFPL